MANNPYNPLNWFPQDFEVVDGTGRLQKVWYYFFFGIYQLLKPRTTVSLAVSPAAGVLTLDWNFGQWIPVTLNSNVTSVSVLNFPLLGQTGEMELFVTNTGAFTISGWPANVIWSHGAVPVITPSGKDLLTLQTPDGATTIWATITGQAYA